MKKNRLLFITATILTAFAFTSCFNAVFYNIRQDVAPEASTVTGVINSICRYTIDGEEYLFLGANEGLRYKLAKTGNVRDSNNSSWKVYSDLPFSLHQFSYYSGDGKGEHTGQTIIKVLADKDTLYLITTDYKHEYIDGYSYPNHTYIWASKLTAESGKVSGTWKEIKFGEEIDGNYTDYSADDQRDKIFPYTYSDVNKIRIYFSHFNFFSTNSINPDLRRVFVRGNNKKGTSGGDCYYELKGLNAPSQINLKQVEGFKDDIIACEDDSTTNVTNIDSVAYLGDTLYFFDSIAVATNEHYKTEKDEFGNTTIVYIKPSILYFAHSESKRKDSEEDYHPSTSTLAYLYLKDGKATLGETTTSCGERISSLAVTKDSILIGRGDYSVATSNAGGIVRAKLSEDGIPATQLSSFDTNASVQLSYSYQILTLLVTEPDKIETENTIYSSITFKGTGSTAGTSFDNIGLWAYYPGRGNWNCE